jgi:hypothetical protein
MVSAVAAISEPTIPNANDLLFMSLFLLELPWLTRILKVSGMTRRKTTVLLRGGRHIGEKSSGPLLSGPDEKRGIAT